MDKDEIVEIQLRKIRGLQKEIRHLKFLARNLKQEVEALGAVNRYYFFMKYSRNAETDEELVRFYIENGGATGFAERNNGRGKGS